MFPNGVVGVACFAVGGEQSGAGLGVGRVLLALHEFRLVAVVHVQQIQREVVIGGGHGVRRFSLTPGWW